MPRFKPRPETIAPNEVRYDMFLVNVGHTPPRYEVEDVRGSAVNASFPFSLGGMPEAKAWAVAHAKRLAVEAAR